MRREGIKLRSDALPSGFDGSLGGLAQEQLELGEHLFDRIEIRKRVVATALRLIG
jgi:hypothetical protein